ncbi:uncharacterized protein PFL1_03786 [Pseudozyma flocculosa PF-1]|uniref:Ceramide glucosyltransferase n=2 Tax=Pseudozyma flocculosa TaxID=84751 RepID=A0A5C3EWG7_9BASI|nr:uncharacterized protein PFL1_03786 [Pseudozyma flocculosa PF-1]EPQ28483.1 hypothetical protein PFL1_03786 [Pseudozyma flocculosa PF-1]SPO36402.1 related to Ceramide glucosyltransferase [Pseudozyma flocculosa]
MWSLFAYLCLAWYAIIWSICLLGLSLARSYFRPPIPRSPLAPHRTSDLVTNALSRPSSDAVPQQRPRDDAGAAVVDSDTSSVPGVSILRPLSGLDCNLVSNLSSSFQQDYPADRFEVLLSIKDTQSSEAQKVFGVAQMVMARYPRIQARIVVGDEVAGVNPKINNLVRPYSQARHDILWVVDSQVWSPPGAMARAVDHLIRAHDQPRPLPTWLGRKPHGSRVGLVHHVPLAVLPGTSWGSQVERVFLSTTHAKMYLAINSLAIDSCVMGKSNMYRRSDLERVPDSFFEVGTGGSRGESGAIGSDAFTRHEGDATAEDDVDVDVDADTDKDARRRQQQQQPLLASSFSRSSPTPPLPSSQAGGAAASSSTAPATTSTTTVATTPHPPSPPTTTTTVRTSSRALARFGIYLAEDNMLALSLWRPPLSLSHVLARGDVAHTSVGDIRTLRDYAERRMRWIRVRKHMVLGATLAEPLTESVVAGLLGLVAVRWFLGATSATSAALFLAAHFAAWGYVDWQVMVALQGGEPVQPGEGWTLIKAWCIREAMALPIWAWAVSGSTSECTGSRQGVARRGAAASGDMQMG